MNKDVKKTVASANLNFLIGAGLSAPFLGVLESIEERLTNAEAKDNGDITDIKKEYFKQSIQGNLNLLETESKMDEECKKVLDNYKIFYKYINLVVLKRESSLLSKQVNIFTTNIDIFSEIALEGTGIDFNDGFHGRFKPKYDVGNFKKSYFKTSLHYENTSEIPVFNILKLHGSVSWKEDNNNILLDRELKLIENFDEFDKLMIVNPTQKKFADTTLNQTYYDLLRIYANELEKENSVLFVAGFSFADKHIKDLTLRVANSNPTLKIYIFSYKPKISVEYEELKNTKNTNVEIILPTKNTNVEIVSPEDDAKYDFENINKFFQSFLVDDNEDSKEREKKNNEL